MIAELESNGWQIAAVPGSVAAIVHDAEKAEHSAVRELEAEATTPRSRAEERMTLAERLEYRGVVAEHAAELERERERRAEESADWFDRQAAPREPRGAYINPAGNFHGSNAHERILNDDLGEDSSGFW